MGDIQTYLIGMLMFSTILIGFGFIYTDMKAQYNSDFTTDVTAYEKLNETYELAEPIIQAVKGTKGTAVDQLTSLVGGALGALKLTFTATWSGITIPIQILEKVAMDFRIPHLYVDVVVVAIVFFLMFTIISAVLKSSV